MTGLGHETRTSSAAATSSSPTHASSSTAAIPRDWDRDRAAGSFSRGAAAAASEIVCPMSPATTGTRSQASRRLLRQA